MVRLVCKTWSNIPHSAVSFSLLTLAIGVDLMKCCPPSQPSIGRGGFWSNCFFFVLFFCFFPLHCLLSLPHAFEITVIEYLGAWATGQFFSFTLCFSSTSFLHGHVTGPHFLLLFSPQLVWMQSEPLHPRPSSISICTPFGFSLRFSSIPCFLSAGT